MSTTKILVAEDEITFRHMLKTFLTKWGYEVTAVSDGLGLRPKTRAEIRSLRRVRHASNSGLAVEGLAAPVGAARATSSTGVARPASRASRSSATAKPASSPCGVVVSPALASQCENNGP